LLAVAQVEGQITTPVFLQQSLQPAAISGSGRTLVLASSLGNSNSLGAEVFSVNVDGTGLRQLTKLSSSGSPGATNVALTSDGRWAAFTVGQGGVGEEVHLLDVAAGGAGDRTLVVDKQGCVLPLALCFGCVYTCLRTPHIADDGASILYYAARSQPFYLAKSDGSPPLNLPVYSGSLAAPAKRVISRTGQVVFTSSAPSGPTFAAAPGQVYLMNLDGTKIRAVTQFTDTSIYSQEATISADGSLIAFTVAANNGVTLFTIHSDGTALSAVASGSISSPSLSADGKILAYVDTGRVMVMSKPITTLKYSKVVDATISDDGTRVAFAIGPLNGGTGAIYSVNSDGTAQTAAYAPRTISLNGVVGAAAGSPVTAGSLATAYGTSFTLDTLMGASSLPLPRSLGGVSLLINGNAAPMSAVSPWQINGQVPSETPVGTEMFSAAFADGPSTAAVSATVAGLGPSIYLLPDISFSQGAVFHGNTATPADPAHPAIAGEALVMYASGLGQTNPVVPAGVGAPANPPAVTTITPQVSVGSKTAQLLFSGLAPGFVGLYQVNAQVPSNAQVGPAVNLMLSVAGVASNVVTIAVQ